WLLYTMAAQLIDPVLPGGHDRLNLVGVAAVARLLGTVREVVAARCTDPFAGLVRDHWKIELSALRRLAEDVNGRLLPGLHEVNLLQEHLAKQDDAPVALTELFEVPLGDVTLRNPAHVVLVKRHIEVGKLALCIHQWHVAGWHDLLLRSGRARGGPPGI